MIVDRPIEFLDVIYPSKGSSLIDSFRHEIPPRFKSSLADFQHVMALGGDVPVKKADPAPGSVDPGYGILAQWINDFGNL